MRKVIPFATAAMLLMLVMSGFGQSWAAAPTSASQAKQAQTGQNTSQKPGKLEGPGAAPFTPSGQIDYRTQPLPGAPNPPATFTNYRAVNDNNSICNSTHTNCSQHEPHVAVNPTNPNNVVAASKDWRPENGNQKHIWLYTTTDGGSSWINQPITYPVGSNVLNSSDVIVQWDALGNVYANALVYNATQLGNYVTKSTDGGVTWGTAVRVDSLDDDKNWMVIDNTPTSPYYGRIYVCWWDTSGIDDYCSYSADHAATWSAPVLFAQIQQGFCYPVVLPDGTLVVFYNNDPTIDFVRSTDGGVSFGSPSTAATISGVYNNRSGRSWRVNSMHAAAAGPEGNLYLTWLDDRNEATTKWDILFARSTDGGTTWSTPSKVNDDTGANDQFEPAISVAPNGRIDLAWMDMRNDPANLLSDTYYSYSTDGGLTFAANQRVTDVNFNLNHGIPSDSNGCAGDYIGISSTNDDVWPVWTDTRNADGRGAHAQDVYAGHLHFDNGTATPTVTGTPPTATPTRTPVPPTSTATATSTPNGPTETPTTVPSATPSPTPCFSTWSDDSNLPVAVAGAAVATIDGYIYEAGGHNGTAAVTAAARYNGSGTWQTIPNLPIATTDAAGVTDGHKFYVIGGFVAGVASNATQIYDPATNSWSMGENSPVAEGAGIAAYVNNIIYVFGGSISPSGSNPLHTVQIYDTTTGGWTTGVDLPAGAAYAASAYTGDEVIVVAGGLDSAGQPTDEAYGYDYADNRWIGRNIGKNQPDESVSPMPEAWWGAASAPLNGQLFVFGGVTSGQLAGKAIYYEPEDQSWHYIPSLHTATYRSAGAELNGKLYIIGGSTTLGNTTATSRVERYELPLCDATPTPIVTDTPTVVATDTATPAAATPTDCGNPFVDLNGNVFYTAIHILYCRGVVNGTDGTHYSPAGTSTRAQFAKVVVLAFGIANYTPASPDFTDVPANYFAYAFIEAGYHAGILSGFDAATCIAIGTQAPCFGPNRPITRAQLTKLVVSAAGYTAFTPTSPTFTDVGTNNVFYVSIETAHHHGVINGYPDNTFRPNNNIRRDEMAQIVYTATVNP